MKSPREESPSCHLKVRHTGELLRCRIGFRGVDLESPDLEMVAHFIHLKKEEKFVTLVGNGIAQTITEELPIKQKELIDGKI